MKCLDCKLFYECRGVMQMGTDCFVPKGKEYDTTSESAFHNYDLGYEEGYEQGKKDAVVHAHWEMDEQGDCKCSACGEWQSYPDNYCCECGAKMDEVEE